MLSIDKKDSESIQEFADDIICIEDELAVGGYVIESFDKCYALLEGLLTIYDTIKTMLREGDDLSFPQIVAKLETREEGIKQQNVGSSEDDDKRRIPALMTDSRVRKKKLGQK